MSRWDQVHEPQTIEQAFQRKTIDDLKPLTRFFVEKPPTRKGELVKLLTRFLSDADQVRTLYEQLPPLAKQAVQEAAHDQHGQIDRQRFEAKYGALPEFSEPAPESNRYSSYSSSRTHPTRLILFLPDYRSLPTDLRVSLQTFVPSPEEYQLPVRSELPATVEMTHETWTARGEKVEIEEVPLRVRLTIRDAEHDMKAVLRLIDVGTVRVTDKKHQPTAAALKLVAGILQGGDFYTAEDQDEYDRDPGSDLTIKPFAWPMIVQAAGLAQVAGDRLELTPAGRKALRGPLTRCWPPLGRSGAAARCSMSLAGSARSRARARPA